MPILIMNIIPIILSTISLTNSAKVIKMSKLYIQNPAGTPFEPIQRMHIKVIVFMVVNIVVGFNFVIPIFYTLFDEFADISEYDPAVVSLLIFALLAYYFAAFIISIAALVKYSSANRIHNQIVYKNNTVNNQNTVRYPYQNTFGNQASPYAYPQNNNAAQTDNLNGFQVIGQRSNDVPEGYEAPPDLNNGYGQPIYNQPQRPFNTQSPASPQTPPANYSQSAGQAASVPNTTAAQKEVLNKDIIQQEYKAPEPQITQAPKAPDLPPIAPIVGSGFGDANKTNPFESKTEKRCPHCGVVNPETSKFCSFCGKEL